jgi:hypothetical protein
MYYYRARYYDPNTGRFLQQDPHPGTLRNPLTALNKYLYVLNNPIIYSDHTGMYLDNFTKFLAFGAGLALGIITGGAIFAFMSGIISTSIGGVVGAAIATMLGAALGTVGAIAGGALFGAIAGGIIGATSVALKGGDLNQGLMEGALFGFVGGGIGGGISALYTGLNNSSFLLPKYGANTFNKLLLSHKSAALGALASQILSLQKQLDTFESNALNSDWTVKLLYKFMGREPVEGSPPDCNCSK